MKKNDGIEPDRRSGYRDATIIASLGYILAIGHLL